MVRLALILVFWGASPALAADAPDFDRDIAPIFVSRCLDCHSGASPKGKLDLSRRESAMAGGEDGKVISPGKVEESPMWDLVERGKMPPKKGLTEGERLLIKRWIESGAKWGSNPIDPFSRSSERRAGRDWWSLQPVVRSELPACRRAGWARNSIDLFVLAGLEAKGLSPNDEAPKRLLIRRVYFDLIGLPPSPAEVDAFLADGSADAYEKVVDRLLASPQYGVRWARHWLDVARFGESNGFEHDEFRPNAWPYRDWVVEALNSDMPYDEFARLQMAGDVLSPGNAGAITATGFLVAGAYDSVGQTQQSLAMRKVVRQDQLEDIVGTVGQTFLGLTVQCARCHDHKFDPIKQSEYYRLTAALAGVQAGERELPVGDSTENDRKAIAAPKRKTYAVTPIAPGNVHLLIRGNTAQPAEELAAGGVAAVLGVRADFGVAADASDKERRVGLAKWITDAKNPLFCRVIVNRLWHYHFGVGLVETPNDFGFNGGLPSNASLLDYLASELVEKQFSLKAMHRLIVTSAAYRQSSRLSEQGNAIDSNNRLIWRKSPLRMEAEAVRDAVLSLAGELNPKLGGPGFMEYSVKAAVGTTTNTYTPVDAVGEDFNRRTLYRAWARGGRSGLLDALDCPDPSATAPARSVTNTPLQALAMLNNAMILRAADGFARRLEREAEGIDAKIVLAYRLAYGRVPSEEELKIARRAVEGNGLSVLTRAIFNSNEFLFVE